MSLLVFSPKETSCILLQPYIKIEFLIGVSFCSKGSSWMLPTVKTKTQKIIYKNIRRLAGWQTSGLCSIGPLDKTKRVLMKTRPRSPKSFLPFRFPE